MKIIPAATTIALTPEERQVLEALVGSRKAEARMRDRVRIVLPLRHQLVVGFSRQSILSTSPCGPGFSGGTTDPIKVQLSGGAEWLEAIVGKRFPRNWGWCSLSNLSCRTFLSEAVARHRS
jgi:hypothetical protein